MGQNIFAALAYPSDSCRAVDTVPCHAEDTSKPRFRFQHRCVSTADDFGRFFVTSRVALDSVFPWLQGQFAIYSLYLWNYASYHRFMFSRDKLDWVGEMYFSLCVAGLVTSTLTVVAVFWLNSSSTVLNRRLYGDGGATEVERLHVDTAHFTYTERVLPAMDAHYDYHVDTGQEVGEPELLLCGVHYVFVLVLTVIDFGVLVDATNKTHLSHAKARVGGLGFLQVVCLIVGLLLTVIPPRRAYQDVAQAYLEERFV